MLAFLAARAIPGVEMVGDGVYRRSIVLHGVGGALAVSAAPGRDALLARVHFPRPDGLRDIVARLRRLFDLAAEPAQVAAALGRDPLLGPLVAARPGLRVAGAWDGFELAVRAVLGQQITVAAASRLAGKLAAAFGDPLPEGVAGPGPSRLFPSPAQLAAADIAALGIPRARAAAAAGLAAAAAADPGLFEQRGSVESDVARLRRLPGIGEWTAQYIAMRALRHPDAFPAADIGLLRALADARGVRPTPQQLLLRAESWRPLRAYAAIHLWAAGPAPPSHSKERDDAADPRPPGVADRPDAAGRRRRGAARAGVR